MMSAKRRSPPKDDGSRPAECLCMGFGPELSRLLQSWGSDAARGHFRNARVEVLRGLRSLIDQRIESLTREKRRGTTIEVE